jgi:hypothetical protein
LTVLKQLRNDQQRCPYLDAAVRGRGADCI